MAAPPPVRVEVLYDDTTLKSGTAESEASIEALADSVETASDQMRASLQSIDDGVSSTLSVGGSFSRGVDDVETEGGRLKEVGTEVGAEFASNLAEGVNSGDLKSVIIDTVAGLGAAAGAAGQLTVAAAGIGVLVGGTLMRALTQKADEEKEQFEQTMLDVIASYRDAIGKINREGRRAQLNLLEDDPESELNKVQELVDDVNAQLARVGEDPLPPGVVESIFVGTPAQRAAALAKFQGFFDNARPILAAFTNLYTEGTGLAFEGTESKLDDINKMLRDQVGIQGDAKAEAIKQLEVLDRLGLLTKEEAEKLDRVREAQGRAADEAERMADAVDRSDAASARLAANLGNAARHSANVDMGI